MCFYIIPIAGVHMTTCFSIIRIAGVHITTCFKTIPIAGAKADRRRAKAKAGAKAESLISSFAYTKRKFQTYF